MLPSFPIDEGGDGDGGRHLDEAPLLKGERCHYLMAFEVPVKLAGATT